MRAATKQNVVTRVWIEPIDNRAYAACASYEEVHRGGIYQANSFLLFDPSRIRIWRAKEMAVDKLREEVVSGQHVRHIAQGYNYVQAGSGYFVAQRNRMPLVGAVRDLKR